MPSTTHVLDEARNLVMKRLAELDDERKRLERALAELGGKAVGPRARPRPRSPTWLGREIRRSAQENVAVAAAAPVPTRP